jgi:pantoate--beta-alanine ligase
MELLRTVAALRAYADGARVAGRRVALVPTMGALHDGHLALVASARERADAVIVSIFVNPTQFGPTEDLASYPRTLDTDLARCRDAGVDAVFAPAASELYPDGAQTFVEVRELGKPLCGASRPHFFGGVATVVTKLLVAARPHVAVFGEKDFQQLQVVRRLARDLLLDVLRSCAEGSQTGASNMRCASATPASPATACTRT